jgi:hypothetical protein
MQTCPTTGTSELDSVMITRIEGIGNFELTLRDQNALCDSSKHMQRLLNRLVTVLVECVKNSSNPYGHLRTPPCNPYCFIRHRFHANAGRSRKPRFVRQENAYNVQRCRKGNKAETYERSMGSPVWFSDAPAGLAVVGPEGVL